MYTEVPTNGDVVGMIILVVLAIVGLLVCANHHRTDRVDDIASWTRNYEKLQRRH